MLFRKLQMIKKFKIEYEHTSNKYSFLKENPCLVFPLKTFCGNIQACILHQNPPFFIKHGQTWLSEEGHEANI